VFFYPWVVWIGGLGVGRVARLSCLTTLRVHGVNELSRSSVVQRGSTVSKLYEILNCIEFDCMKTD